MRTLNLTIDRLAYGPTGVGRANGKVIFVPGVVPGDQVKVVVDEEKETYATAHVVELAHASPQRRQPPCPYVPRCGGCPWQQITYGEQLRAKEALVREQMRRIGGIADPPVRPIIPCAQEWGYRHRLRLRAEENTRLGFYQARSHELVEITSCLITGDGMAAQLQMARAWLASVRTVVLRVELMSDESSGGLILVGNAQGAFYADDDDTCAQFLRTHAALGRIVGIVLFGRGWRRVWGNTQLSFALGVDDLTLTVSAGVFTQVNPVGNRALIAAVLELGDFDNTEHVVELYCGAGNLSLPLARRVKSLTGIEQDSIAVADARANAARSGLDNTRFLRASARAGVEELLRQGVRGDLVVLDPPRAGAAEVIDAVPRLRARRVLYVSCDPATLARDLRRLTAHGYQLHALQPLDLFPHTYHVETVALSILTC